MPNEPDRQGEPWPGATYNGFSGPTPPQGPPPPRFPRKLVIGGLALAVGLGLVFGLWARPDFGDDGRAREPMKAVAQGNLPVEVNAPVMTPPPETPGRLEVLPADLVRAAPRPPEQLPRPAVAPAPPPVAAAPPARDASARAPSDEPGFDCRYARSASEQMVCEDPRLASADRRLNRAYERAVRAGVPPRELRAEQDDWMQIREDAARHSPRALDSVYEQRTRELNDIADGNY